MKLEKPLKLSMMILLAGLLSLSFAGNAFAQKDQDAEIDDENDPPSFKVIKVKKNIATVVFSRKHSAPKVGQKGRLVAKVAKSGGDENVEGPSRDHFISFNADLSMLSQSSDKGGSSGGTNNVFNMNLVYGWNKESFEYGALLGYKFSKVDPASDSRTIELGLRFDYNFVPNKVENDMVFGLRVDAAVGQQDSSGQSKGYNTMRVEPGVFVKWFGLSPNLAMTGVVGYRYSSVTVEDDKLKTTGIVGAVGIETYF